MKTKSGIETDGRIHHERTSHRSDHPADNQRTSRLWCNRCGDWFMPDGAIKEPAHSPLPWRTWTSGDKISIVETINPLEICSITLYRNGREKSNAALIVRAVNSHSDLLAACEALIHAVDGMSMREQIQFKVGAARDAARAIVIKAKTL